MNLLQWDSTGRRCYLLDTFAGIGVRFLLPEEKADAMLHNAQTIDKDARCRDNFSEWKNAKSSSALSRGRCPRSTRSKSGSLHLDLNCALLEVATMQALWDRLTPGASCCLMTTLMEYLLIERRGKETPRVARFRDRGTSPLANGEYCQEKLGG
jgi:hypothetical protein